MRVRQEHHPDAIDRSVVVGRHPGPRFGFDWHYHPQLEVTLIVSGRGVRLVGDSLAESGPGDLVVIGPNLAHTWASEPSAMMPADAVWALCSTEHLRSIPELRRLNGLIAASDRGLAFGIEVDDARSLLASADSLSEYDQVVAVLRVLAILADHIDQAARLATPHYVELAANRRPVGDVATNRLTQVFAHVAAHHGEPIRHEDVCALVGMSPAGFSRFFRLVTGRTFTTYVNEYRIAEACHRLGNSDETVAGIAQDVGFGSLANFNRTFLRLKGVSPSAWRRNLERYQT